MTKLGTLNFFRILTWCLCFILFLVWTSVAYSFFTGAFNKKIIYPTSIYFEQTALRINGIEESDNENVKVDKTFIVRCYPSDTTELEIELMTSNSGVATVPTTVNIGDEVTVTASKTNGVNNGGYCKITAKNSKGIFSTSPLYIFVDIPVDSIELDLTGVNVLAPNEDEIELGAEYSIYASDSCNLETAFVVANSQNPSQIGGSVIAYGNTTYFDIFNNLLDSDSSRFPLSGTTKIIDYEVTQNSDDAVIEFDSSSGEILALKEGIVTITATVLKTYTDILFVEDYEPPIGWDDTPTDEEMVGRLVEASITIYVRPIELNSLEVTSYELSVGLFDEKTFTADELGLKLISNKGDADYFASLINNIQITSSDSSAITIEKVVGSQAWTFTINAQPSSGFTINASLADYDLSVDFENFSITSVAIESLDFYGTSKESENSTYNDFVELSIVKNSGVVTTGASWNYNNYATITPVSGYISSTYTKVLVFAVGMYTESGAYKKGVYVNDEGDSIIRLGDEYTDIGAQVISTDNTTKVQALGHGTIVLRACVVKTNIDGLAIDSSNNIITSSSQSYVIIVWSDEISVKVTELLNSNLKATILVESEDEEGTVTETSQDLTSTSNIRMIVEHVNSLAFVLTPNSYGAMVDAYNNNWLSITSNDDIIESVLELKEEIDEEGGDTTKYWQLKVIIANLNDNEEQRDVTVSLKVLSQGQYQIILSLLFKVIQVPTASIAMQTSLNPDVEDGSYYSLLGKMSVVEDENDLVTSMTCNWGKIENSQLNEFEILTPSFQADTIDINLETGFTALYPKILSATNQTFTIESLDETILEIEADGSSYTVIQLDKDVVIRVTSGEVYNEITVNFSLPSVSFEWLNFQDVYTINSTTLSQSNGVMLSIEEFYCELLTSSTAVIGSGENPLVRANSEYISFAVDSSSQGVVEVIDYEDDLYTGQVLRYKDLPQLADITIIASLTTNDGLAISKSFVITITQG